MATVTEKPKKREPRQPISLLSNGDRLTQREFHRRYQAYSKDVKIELVGGVVYMASPAKRPHSRRDGDLGTVFGTYTAYTPGVDYGHNATVILGRKNEPQPDSFLRICEDCGGQSRLDVEDYIVGSPELLAEIALSSVAIDLHAKKDDYQDAGVIEYIVVCVEEEQVVWFDLQRSRQLRADDEGVIRSRVFPGLWLDTKALIEEDSLRLIETLNRGLAAPEHRKFVEKLAAKRSRNK